MFDYNNDAEEIRRALDFQYFFEEAPYIKKSEVPPWLVRLDKQFEGFSDLSLSKKVEEGRNLINLVVEKVIERKLTLTQKVYPKIQELSMFYYQEWIKPEVFPAQKKEKEYIAQLKAKMEARKKGTFEIDKRTPEEFIKDFISKEQQEDYESKQRFKKFFDLLYSKKDLIKEVKVSIREWNKDTFPAGWIFRRTNELLEAIGQHKKDKNSDEDKSHIVDLLGIATLAKSLYWNDSLVEENLVGMYSELDKILLELEFWPTEDFIEFCKKEGKQALDDLNSILEDMYSRYRHTRFDFYYKVLGMWDAEQMLARELKAIEPVVSLPDKLREKVQKWMSNAEKSEIQKDKLLTMKELAEHYNMRSTSGISHWKEKGAPFHGTKARISEIDKWLETQKEKRSQIAKERYKNCHKRTFKK